MGWVERRVAPQSGVGQQAGRLARLPDGHANVIGFAPDVAGRVALRADWTLVDRNGGAVLTTRSEALSSPAGRTTDEIVSLLGQMVDMLAVGVLAAAGLWLAGVPLPFALGMLAGLLTFIPYFGAILAGIPGVMIALNVGWTTALWAVAVYLACHAVEGYVVAPLVQRRLVDMPPALLIVSMTVMGTLFGPLGIVVGAPVAAAGLVVVRELFVRDALGDFGGPPVDGDARMVQ